MAQSIPAYPTYELTQPPFILVSFRHRKKHTYPPGFPRWLISTPLEEIEDTIGTDSFNKLIFKFMNETPKTRNNKDLLKEMRKIYENE